MSVKSDRHRPRRQWIFWAGPSTKYSKTTSNKVKKGLKPIWWRELRLRHFYTITNRFSNDNESIANQWFPDCPVRQPYPGFSRLSAELLFSERKLAIEKPRVHRVKKVKTDAIINGSIISQRKNLDIEWPFRTVFWKCPVSCPLNWHIFMYNQLSWTWFQSLFLTLGNEKVFPRSISCWIRLEIKCGYFVKMWIFSKI